MKKCVAAGATMVGIPARQVLVDASDGSGGFLPYGTPCSEISDPVLARLCELEREINLLRAQRGAERPKAKSA